MAGFRAVVVLAIIHVLACGETDSGQVDAGPPSVTCGSHIVRCIGLGRTECGELAGCSYSPEDCIGEPDYCNSHPGGSQTCDWRDGCVSSGPNCVYTGGPRRCPNAEQGSAVCEADGCAYVDARCGLDLVSCTNRSLEVCEADGRCVARCPSGYTVCDRGCVRDWEAANDSTCAGD